MRNRVYLFSAALLLGTLLVGCSAATGTREIQVTASDYKFEPSVIPVKPGERVKITVTNHGAVDHEFESEEAKIEELVIPAGKSRSVTITAPAKAGEYQFFCDVPGHQAMGMVGKIVVGQ
ncbi:MAG: cupredoxin domain-containing protein [Mycobacterium leprae]